MSAENYPETRATGRRRSRYRFLRATDALLQAPDRDRDAHRPPATFTNMEKSGTRPNNTTPSHLGASFLPNHLTGEPSYSREAYLAEQVDDFAEKTPGVHFEANVDGMDGTLATLPTEHFYDEPSDGYAGDGMNSMDDTSQADHDEDSVIEMHPSLKIANWRVLWVLVVTSGSQKLSKQQYECTRIIADAFRKLPCLGNGFSRTHAVTDEELEMPTKVIKSLPHFTTLAHRYKRLLFDHLTVRCIDTENILDTRKAGARSNAFSADGAPMATVRTVLPSEYARMDLSTTKVQELMHSTSLTAFEGRNGPVESPSVCMSDCVDLWPVVAAREYFYGPPQHISVDADSRTGKFLSSFAEVGDTILTSLLGRGEMSRIARDALAPVISADGYVQIRGEIIALWPVYHSSRRGTVCEEHITDTKITLRDKQIFYIFQFADYQSPSDLITAELPEIPQNDADLEGNPEFNDNVVLGQRAKKRKRLSPEIEQAMKERREALRRRKKQLEQAWLHWKKPVIKPGDVVCLLRPCTSDSCDFRARVLLIHRFWIENEERRTHVIWIPDCTSLRQDRQNLADVDLTNLCQPFAEDAMDKIRDVVSCRLYNVHSGPRGMSKFRPISSFGILDNGERYLIYRFMLFWDGFEVAKGKSSSGEGVYLVCLNLPIKARSSSNAVRILSLCPPGVKASSVLKTIQEDIVHGMTDGFVDFDATGKQCRLFLDLVGFLGDTPALNACLDTLGHTATACCHLCRYTKRSCDLGSRYADEGSHGLLTGTGRSFFHHAAVRDCNAQKETCRLLGMKATSSDSDLPLHSLRRAMLEARHRIQTTADGVPILTGYLDPYRACYIAPDHLLTGHLRDCANLAFRLLPTTHSRSLAEKYMIGFLSDCDLTTQNRLFDMGSKSLFSMSMTELYALSIVAEFSFLKAYHGLSSTLDTVVARKCAEAISLVGSTSRLIAHLWRLHSPDRDSSSTVAAFNAQHGTRYVMKVQSNVQRHLSQLRRMCELSDADVDMLDGDSLSPQDRTLLLKERSLCLLSKRIIDKPNVHRLVELVYTTLPMVGHISRVGELVLERAHQTLKRAIRQGNHNQIQLSSMTSAIYSDWEGRLNSQLRGAMRGDPLDTLGCFRLQAGRQEVFNIKAGLTDSTALQVRKALGPEACIPSVLQAGNRTVFSIRADPDFFRDLSWWLKSSNATGIVQILIGREPLSNSGTRRGSSGLCPHRCLPKN